MIIITVITILLTIKFSCWELQAYIHFLTRDVIVAYAFQLDRQSRQPVYFTVYHKSQLMMMMGVNNLVTDNLVTISSRGGGGGGGSDNNSYMHMYFVNLHEGQPCSMKALIGGRI